MLNMSGLLHDLEHHSFSPTGPVLYLYGDPAYPHRVHLQCPFARRPNLTPEEQAFNQSMSQVRISVEWVFGDIVNYFKFTDFKKDLKIGLSAVGKIYMVCALLCNAMTCLYGNNSSKSRRVFPVTCVDPRSTKQLFLKLPKIPSFPFLSWSTRFFIFVFLSTKKIN